jgi:transcription elongation factor Elf1
VIKLKNDLKRVKRVFNDKFTCRFCSGHEFFAKKLPYFVVKPPLKVGILCVGCGETLVVSFNDYWENFHL